MYLKMVMIIGLAIPMGGFAAQVPAGAVLGPVTVVREQVGVAAGGFVQTATPCPAGKVVLGGGARVVNAGGGGFNTVLRESAPDTVGGGAQSVWLASVSNNDPVARTIGVHAVCANAPAGYQLVRKDVTVAAGRVVLDIVLCPTGKVILGGGGVVAGAGAGNFHTVVQESAPGINGRGQSFWWLTLRNDGATARTIAILAVCAYPVAGYQLVRQDFALPAFGYVADNSLCPVGKQVLAGGGVVVGAGLGDFNTVVRETAPGTIERGEIAVWMTRLGNNSAVARTAALMAVCAYLPAGYQQVRTDTTIA